MEQVCGKFSKFQCDMPPLPYIHASEAARTTTGGGLVGGSGITPHYRP